MAASRMPVPVAERTLSVENGGFDMRCGHHRRHLLHELVQAGDRDLRRPETVERGAHLRRAPQEDEYAENEPGRPGAPHGAEAVGRNRSGGSRRVLRWRSRRASRSSGAPDARPSRNSASDAIETMAATMSTSQGPWKFETTNWGIANDRPATRIGGQISSVLRQPTNAVTSQNGTSTEKNGSCRPTMPLSS